MVIKVFIIIIKINNNEYEYNIKHYITQNINYRQLHLPHKHTKQIKIIEIPFIPQLQL